MRSPGDSVGHRAEVRKSAEAQLAVDSARDAVGRIRECGNLQRHRLDSLRARQESLLRGGSRLTWPADGAELARDQTQQRSLATAVGPDHARPSGPRAAERERRSRVETESGIRKDRPDSRTNIVAAPQNARALKKIARAGCPKTQTME